MQIVINRCSGGFGLSEEAYAYLLIDCIETLGDRANGRFARLKVVEIPDLC